MRALTVIGPFSGLTGYDHHVREFVRALVRAAVRVQLRDLPLWSPRKLPAGLRDPWFDTLCEPVSSKITLHFCMPHQLFPVPGQRNVNFTMFEGTPAPASWVERSRQHDLVIVPSDSSRAAWIAGGLSEDRLRLCPLGIDPVLFNGTAAPLPLALPDGTPVARFRVRFMNVSEIRYRKNLMGLLRTWIAATKPEDDAILILKLGHYRSELPAFESAAHALRTDSGKTLAEAAPVHFVYDVYSDSEMSRLYPAATHYLSMSFGEGWDQPAMEAAASGLKLIVPRHSAYPAYLDDSCATFLASREVPARLPATDDAATLFEHTNWWQPDEQEAAAHIRSAIEGRDAAKGDARSRILSRFTWEQAAGRLIETLSELDPPRKRFWFPFR